MYHVSLCIATEVNATELVMCTYYVRNCDNVSVRDAVTVFNIVYFARSESDRDGDVYCVNCDNVSKVL